MNLPCPQSSHLTSLFVTEDHEKVIKQLQNDLDAKEDLINRKQAELSRANQKHYELEQELAFYKIDTKFTSLHKKPETPSVDVSMLYILFQYSSSWLYALAFII